MDTKIDIMEVYADQSYVDLANHPTNKATNYAILIGISDYKFINDLEYCDEDVTSWYNFFKSKNYKTFVYGDEHKEKYPIYTGLATESNVRQKIKNVILNAKKDDTVAIVTSGHGSGDGKGNSYLCMFDSNGKPQGNYTDKEFYDDIKNAKCKLFVFYDNCYSGGMLEELKPIKNIFATSTCSENGFGYDDAASKNGAWTQCFLEDVLSKYNIKAPIDLVEVFTKASTLYPYDKGDKPMMICNDVKFYI